MNRRLVEILLRYSTVPTATNGPKRKRIAEPWPLRASTAELMARACSVAASRYLVRLGCPFPRHVYWDPSSKMLVVLLLRCASSFRRISHQEVSKVCIAWATLSS